jgi:hypothetical protein
VLSLVVSVGSVLAFAWLDQPRAAALRSEIGAAAGAVRGPDPARLRRSIETLSGFGSRMTGSEGAERARRYLLEQLRLAGASDVTTQSFETVVPGHDRAELSATVGGKSLSVRLHPVWPNLALASRTAPGGLSGRPVDIGSGSEDELRGEKLAGAIAVMEWDSDLEWLSVPEFGGRAVVFRGTRPAPGSRARRKFLSVPVDFPRYYVEESDLPDLERLMAAKPAEVRIECDARWQRVSGKNLLVRVCPGGRGGAAMDRTPILFHAYYDSISVVPDLAPGAEQACGAAALLEVVRHFTEHPAPRPVYALFTSGHGQALAGMVHFVREVRAGRVPRPGLFVGLDISSKSDAFGIFCLGHFRGQRQDLIRHKFAPLGRQLYEFARTARGSAEDEPGRLPAFVDGVNLTMGRGWWTFFPYRTAFESELPTLAGMPGITLATVNDERGNVDTPHDTVARMRLDLLARQLQARSGERAGLLGICRAVTRWTGPFVTRPLADRWASVRGRVVWLDQRRNYTPSEPLRDAMVFLKTARGDKYALGTRGIPAVLTDDGGAYAFEGLIQVNDNREFARCHLEAYATAVPEFLTRNPEAVRQYLATRRGRGAAGGAAEVERDGSIVFALDMARPRDYPWEFETSKPEQHLNLVTFPCTALSLLGLTDPRGYLPLTDVQILESATKSQPFQFGSSAPDSRWGDSSENLAVVWTDPSTRIMVTLGLGYRDKRLVLINNAQDRPEGRGFVIDEIRTLPSMVLQGATDMWNLDDARIRKLEANGVNNPRIRKAHDESGGYLAEARRGLAERDYRRYRIASERGWAVEGQAYAETLGSINNMIHGVLFYLALLVPLAYFLERLLIAARTVKGRIIGVALVFSACFALLVAVHPAFRFTFTPLLVLLAFVILTLVVAVSFLVVSKMDAVLQERKVAAVGRHEEQRRTAGLVVRALDLGISNIRRRPQRGALTGLTVITTTFILLSFTSLVPVTSISRLPHPRGQAGYAGLLARHRGWAPLPEPMYLSLKRDFGRAGTGSPAEKGGTVVAARGWFYSDRTGMFSQVDLSAVKDAAGAGRPASCMVAALACLEPQEFGLTGVGRTLVAGRWFRSEDEAAIILSEYVAGQLGYGRGDVGRPVRLFGADVPLVGIVDGDAFDGLRDLDGEPLTPVNFVMQRQKMAQLAQSGEDEEADTLDEFVHYSANQIAIVPFGYGRRLGASIRGVAVRAGAGTDVAAEAAGYSRRSNLTILGSDGDSVTLYAALNTSKLSAAWQIAVPMFLAFIMILGTMMGSVYERRGEIFIYNSVGLSPTHVSALFLAESAVYAVVGAGLGYLLGQATAKVLQVSGLLSGLTLNYSAGTTILVTLLAMGIVFVSSIYPARQAFRAAVPETEVEVEPGSGETEGSADGFSCYLPFVASPEHVTAMQAYLAEYLESIQGVTIGRLAIDGLRTVCVERAGRPEPGLLFRAWLAPFDLGVGQDVDLRIVFREDRCVHQYRLTVRRYSGDHQNWQRLQPRFLDAIRRQLLMWRILGADQHEKYKVRGAEMFGGGQ